MAGRGRMLAGIFATAAAVCACGRRPDMARDGGPGGGGEAGIGAGGVGGVIDTRGAAPALEGTPCRIIAPVAWQVAFAADAPRAVAVGFAGLVLDTDAWALRRSFAAHDGVVLWGAVWPDGTRGATIGNDGVLRLWRTDDGVEIARTTVAAAASPPAQTIGVSGALSRNGAVAIVDLATGMLKVLDPATLAVRWMAGAPASVGSMMFTPDGGTLIVGATDQFLRFDASSGTPLPPVMVPGSDGHGTLSGDGQVLATTGSRVQTLRYPDGTPTMSPVIAQVAGAIALSRDGSVLAVSSLNGVRLVQTSDGAEIRSLSGPGYYISIAFSKDDTYVGAAGGALTVWRRSDGNVMFNSGGTLGGATLSPVRPVLATADNQWQTITIWDHAQGQIVRVFSDASPNNYHVAGFSQAGRLYAAVQGIMWRGLLYDLAQAQPLSSVRYTFTTQEPDWAAGGLLVTGDERFLVGTGDYNHPGRARIWDTASGTLVRTLPSHESAIWTLAIDNRNKRIATAGYDVPRTTLTGPDGGIAIKVWDQESGALLQSFVGHTDMVVEVAFSPDGRQLLSGGKDGRVRLWSIADGSVVRDFAGPTDRLTSRTWYGLGVSFSPNGRLIASAGNDSSVRDGSTVVNVWSTETGSLVRHLQVRGDVEGYFANWSADGKAIVGTGPGGLYVWCVDDLDGAAASP